MGNCLKNEQPDQAIKGQAPSEKSQQGKKEYSWDARKAINQQDFIFSQRKGESLLKEPGSINGQQFVIEDCSDCDIWLCDYSATVSVDVCQRCRIFIGPVESSIFIRNCTDCKFIIACQQFRTRDCEQCDFLLYTQTQPIIESSRRMRFGCFVYFYPKLQDQFHSANLSVYNNKWWQIYDFTGSNNWNFLPQDISSRDMIKPPTFSGSMVSGFDDSTPDIEVVPVSWGGRPPQSSEVGFVLVFSKFRSVAAQIIFNAKSQGLMLVQSIEQSVPAALAKLVFSRSSNGKQLMNLVANGNVVGLEFSGSDCIRKLAKIGSDQNRIAGQSGPSLYFSEDGQTAAMQVKSFFVVKNESHAIS